MNIYELTHWGWDKWLPFLTNDVFKFILLNENLLYIVIKISPTLVLKGLAVIIGSDNGLAQDRQQAIIWTNDDLACWSTSMN